MATNYVDYDYWDYGYAEGDTRFVFSSASITASASVSASANFTASGNASISANATVTAQARIQGEGWTPEQFDANTWTPVAVDANAWTPISYDSNTWNKQELEYYVVPGYWQEGYSLDRGVFWDNKPSSTQTWNRIG